MADSKISELTQAAALTGVEVTPVVQSGSTVKASVQQLATAITGATGTNGETVTTSKPRADLTQTWNASGTSFTGVKFNVTDTASAAGSLLADFQVGGVSKFRVDKTGKTSVFGNGAGNVTLIEGYYDSGSTRQFYLDSFAQMYFRGGGISFGSSAGSSSDMWIQGGNGIIYLKSTGAIGWGASAASGAIDTTILRDAAQTLAQRNGVNAQTFRLYKTYTDASNYERGFMRWNSNVLEIGAEGAGTGASRELKIVGGTSIGVGLTLSAAGSAVMDFVSAGSAVNLRLSGAVANVQSNFSLSWASGSTVTVDNDLRIARAAASVLAINNASTGGGALQVTEMTAPAAPATNSVRIYAEDDGAGKTRLMALFATGAAQQLAIEP